MTDEPNRTWSGIVNLVTDDEQHLTDTEVVAELARRGIDTTTARDRVLQAVHVYRTRTRLETARRERPSLLEQLQQRSISLATSLHETIRELIEGRTTGTLQAAYFRRLEGAASEQDLRQLLADLEQLSEWDKADE